MLKHRKKTITHLKAEISCLLNDLPLAVSMRIASVRRAELTELTELELACSPFQSIKSIRPLPSMPIGKPRPTGAVGSSSSHKKNIWSNIAEAQLPKSNYEYRRLVGNQIRILRLHAAESSTDTIECSFEVHDTDELSNHYNALSYTWGNEDAIQKILLRAPQEPTTGTGKARFQAFAQKMTKTRFYIRPNLEDALRQFRDTNPNTQQDLLLWIDAICINQIDEEE